MRMTNMRHFMDLIEAAQRRPLNIWFDARTGTATDMNDLDDMMDDDDEEHGRLTHISYLRQRADNLGLAKGRRGSKDDDKLMVAAYKLGLVRVSADYGTPVVSAFSSRFARPAVRWVLDHSPGVGELRIEIVRDDHWPVSVDLSGDEIDAFARTGRGPMGGIDPE